MKKLLVWLVNTVLDKDYRICYCGKVTKFDDKSKGCCCVTHYECYTDSMIRSAWGCQDYLSSSVKQAAINGQYRGSSMG